MWNYPTADNIMDITAQLAKVLVGSCAQYFLGAQRITGMSIAGIDVGTWIVGNTMLVSVVGTSVSTQSTPVMLPFPADVAPIRGVTSLWGKGNWVVQNGRGGPKLTRQNMFGLETDIFTVRVQTTGLSLGHATMDLGTS